MTANSPPERVATPVRLLLVDVHAISRATSRALLDALADFDVVGETSEHREALELVAQLAPDVVIISMRVQGSTGPQTARAILERHPDIPVVFWTLFDDPEYVRSALAAGARAYVLKQDPAREVELAIDHAMRGQTYLSTGLQHLQ
jgi:DNA-binding NarL/FixJ family response regulator